MSCAPVIDALAIPPDARVDQRVPKKLLLEQGAPTAADKRQIQDGVEEMLWVAALKPTNIGVPTFRDDVREYLEIAVLTATLRAAAKPTRLIELIHRAIPLSGLLMAARRHRFPAFRWRTNAGRRARRARWSSRTCTARPRFDRMRPRRKKPCFSPALSQAASRDIVCALSGLARPRGRAGSGPDHRHRYAHRKRGRAAALRDGLRTCAKLREIARLRAQAEKEKQLNRRVELNLEIKRLEAKVAATEKAL